jgi:hypothetical protein
MRLADEVTARKDAAAPRGGGRPVQPKREAPAPGGSMAAAFARLKR